MISGQNTDMQIVSEIKKDHNILFEELKTFKKNPKSLISFLQQRLKYYRSVKGKQYLFSQNHAKKAMQIQQSETPNTRINQLIDILKNTEQINTIIEVPKLYQCASKIAQTLSRKIPKQIVFKPETSQLIRRILDQDDIVKYPNDVLCLVSISFNQEHASLLNLLLDENLQERPNRKTLLDSKFKYFGVCSAINPQYKHLKCAVYLLTDKAILKKDSRTLNDIKISQTSSNVREKIHLGTFIENHGDSQKQKERYHSKQLIQINPSERQSYNQNNTSIIRQSTNRYNSMSPSPSQFPDKHNNSSKIFDQGNLNNSNNLEKNNMNRY